MYLYCILDGHYWLSMTPQCANLKVNEALKDLSVIKKENDLNGQFLPKVLFPEMTN